MSIVILGYLILTYLISFGWALIIIMGARGVIRFVFGKTFDPGNTVWIAVIFVVHASIFWGGAYIAAFA